MTENDAASHHFIVTFVSVFLMHEFLGNANQISVKRRQMIHFHSSWQFIKLRHFFWSKPLRVCKSSAIKEVEHLLVNFMKERP